jgi:hypothetical protein
MKQNSLLWLLHDVLASFTFLTTGCSLSKNFRCRRKRRWENVLHTNFFFYMLFDPKTLKVMKYFTRSKLKRISFSILDATSTPRGFSDSYLQHGNLFSLTFYFRKEGTNTLETSCVLRMNLELKSRHILTPFNSDLHHSPYFLFWLLFWIFISRWRIFHEFKSDPHPPQWSLLWITPND